jgi:T-complex protein 1 subunit gamma
LKVFLILLHCSTFFISPFFCIIPLFIPLNYNRIILDTKTKRVTGRQAQLGNIQAAKAVAGIIRTTLGPQSMLKMLLDPMGGIVITNDGHCILREVDVSHPTAKSMIELSRAQDEEVGDGTTSVIVLSAQVLSAAEPFLMGNYHPTVIVQAYTKALSAALQVCEELAVEINVQEDKEWVAKLVHSSIGTKLLSKTWNDLLVQMAVQAVTTVAVTSATGGTMVDIKRYAKVEKIPGGELHDSQVVKGVMFQKDVTHSKMRKRIENPRILLLDTPLEYKKGESQTNMEITDEQDWNTILRLEEDYVENMCKEIIAMKPDIVITEKGVSDLAQHYLQKAGITAFRRLRKSDNNRISRAVGATIVSRTDEIQESDIGTGCGLFEMRKLSDDWFCFLEECSNPKACSIVLRGGSKDVLNEVERNLQDAMQVVRNVVYNPKLLPGGGATEMAVAVALRKQGQAVQGVQQAPFIAVGEAMEVIPRTLAQNCGVSVIRIVTQLRAAHAAAIDKNEKCYLGINGMTGDMVDMNDLGIWEPYSVKVQTIKTALENACMIL